MRLQTSHRSSRFNLGRINLCLPRAFSSLPLWLPVLTFPVFVYILINSPFFTLKRHTCTYFEGQPCPEILEAELKRYHQHNIFNFSPDHLVQKILAVEPMAKQVDIKVSFPHSFSLQITPDDLLAQIKVSTNSGNLLVSRSHHVIGLTHTPSPNLPQIVDPGAINLRTGDQISDSPLAYALTLIKHLSEAFIHPQAVYVYSDRLILVSLSHSRQAIFSTHSDLSRQLTSLQLILSKATIMEDLPVIDVRFDQPVLRPYR